MFDSVYETGVWREKFNIAEKGTQEPRASLFRLIACEEGMVNNYKPEAYGETWAEVYDEYYADSRAMPKWDLW